MKAFTSKTIGLIGLAAILSSATAIAGEMAGPMQPVSVAGAKGSLIDPITGSVSVGYDSHYIFRGSNLGEDAPWGSIDLSMPLGRFTVDAGAWYINPTDPAGAIFGAGNTNDELDLYASIGTNVGPVNVALGYTAYIFPEATGGEQNEIGLSLGTSVGFIDVAFAYYHNFDIISPAGLNLENYFEWSAGTTFQLSDRIGLTLGASLGHFEDKLSNVIVSASLPIQVTDNMVFEPYIAGSIDLDDIPGAGRSDELFGGASLNVSF